MLVKDIMTQKDNCVTVNVDSTLHTAVVEMIKNDLDHVIVIDESKPVSLITQKKALLACVKTGKPIDDISISGFSQGFDNFIKPDTTALFAVSFMKQSDEGILIVKDGMDILGTLTEDDLVKNLSNLRREMLENSEMPENPAL